MRRIIVNCSTGSGSRSRRLQDFSSCPSTSIFSRSKFARMIWSPAYFSLPTQRFPVVACETPQLQLQVVNRISLPVVTHPIARQPIFHAEQQSQHRLIVMKLNYDSHHYIFSVHPSIHTHSLPLHTYYFIFINMLKNICWSEMIHSHCKPTHNHIIYLLKFFERQLEKGKYMHLFVCQKEKVRESERYFVEGPTNLP